MDLLRLKGLLTYRPTINFPSPEDEQDLPCLDDDRITAFSPPHAILPHATTTLILEDYPEAITLLFSVPSLRSRTSPSLPSPLSPTLAAAISVLAHRYAEKLEVHLKSILGNDFQDATLLDRTLLRMVRETVYILEGWRAMSKVNVKLWRGKERLRQLTWIAEYYQHVLDYPDHKALLQPLRFQVVSLSSSILRTLSPVERRDLLASESTICKGSSHDRVCQEVYAKIISPTSYPLDISHERIMKVATADIVQDLDEYGGMIGIKLAWAEAHAKISLGPRELSGILRLYTTLRTMTQADVKTFFYDEWNGIRKWIRSGGRVVEGLCRSLREHRMLLEAAECTGIVGLMEKWENGMVYGRLWAEFSKFAANNFIRQAARTIAFFLASLGKTRMWMLFVKGGAQSYGGFTSDPPLGVKLLKAGAASISDVFFLQRAYQQNGHVPPYLSCQYKAWVALVESSFGTASTLYRAKVYLTAPMFDYQIRLPSAPLPDATDMGQIVKKLVTSAREMREVVQEFPRAYLQGRSRTFALDKKAFLHPRSAFLDTYFSLLYTHLCTRPSATPTPFSKELRGVLKAFYAIAR